MDRFEINLTESKLEKIGNEGTGIVQVSSYFKDPGAVREAASAQEYARINPHYPGVRAPVEPELLEQLCKTVSGLRTEFFGAPDKRWIGQAWYSIVTAPASKLTPIQRLPHFDGFDEEQLAIMIYINRTDHGGTAFYRQKATGFETVTEQRFSIYKERLEAGVQSNGLPPAEYISDGAPLFEQIADFGALFNSLILYPGTALHSGVIDNELPLSSDPSDGRLTINGFFKPAR